MIDKVDRFYLLSIARQKICRVSCKNWVIFVRRQNRLILSSKIEHVLSSTILLTDFLYMVNKFCLCCHADCLQRKMNIYSSYFLRLLFIFLLFIFVH